MNLHRLSISRRRPRASALFPRRGFSTLELLAAITIGLIAMTIGISGFQIFREGSRVESTATRLSHAFSTARSFAISHNSYYQVRIDLELENFWIDEIPDPAVNPDAEDEPLTPKVAAPEPFGEQVSIEGIRFGSLAGPLIEPNGTVSQPVSIIFAPDGSAQDDVRVTFFLATDDPSIDENVTTVRVYGPTGHSKVFHNQRV